MKQAHGSRANFLFVYIREAHAADEWRMEENDRAGVVVAQPRTFGERRAAAAACCAGLDASIPAVVDGMDDAVAIPYGAWPERMFVIDAEGTVLYRGAPGPFGFLPAEVEAVLKGLP